jgi:hypothetical protein
MSAWQFKVKLLPAEGAINLHRGISRQLLIGQVSERVLRDKFDTLQHGCEELPGHFDGFPELKALETAISELLPERKSWSELARMFGIHGEDDVEIWQTEAGSLSRISLSFSLRDPNFKYIQSALACASIFKRVFLGIQSGVMFSPSVVEFVTHAEKCSAARFIPNEKQLSSMIANSEDSPK